MMACLAVPQSRHRASSTNIRPALTLDSLGPRRRSNSVLDLSSPVSSPRPQALSLSIPASDPPTSHLFALLSRCSQLLHMSPTPPISCVPSSPCASRSSTDSILPISSPVTKTFESAFAEPLQQKPQPWWDFTPSIHTPVLLVLMLFPLSTALVFLSISTLPVTVSWPRNLTDLAQLGRELHGYSQSGARPMAHVIGVMSIAAVWKHAWSIPGSVIWNVLAGALLTPAYATILLTALTTIGSVFASLLSMPLGPFITRVFPRALTMTRNALEGDSASADSTAKSKTPAWVRLSILRLIGIVPWSGINLACGVCGVALKDCFLGAFIGSLPWTAVTCQIGDILQTVASNPSPTPQTMQSVLASPEILLKLAFLSFLSLAPILGRDYLRSWLSPSEEASLSREVERVSRWAWVKEWQSKIRVPSRSRTREALRKELEALTQEKQTLPM